MKAVFDRISRDHHVATLDVSSTEADEIAAEVYNYAAPRCMSRDVEVVVDLDDMAGTIFCGFQVGGSFKLIPE